MIGGTAEFAPAPGGDDPLRAYSEGRITGREAVRRLGLRDHAELLVRLGDVDLPLPQPAPDELEREVETFEALWRMS